MENIRFKMTFLDSIVLSKTSNTEGNIEPLDFVSGSCFLGIVAKEYNSFENPFMIFHSGDVRFGDAHLLHKGKKTYKIPLPSEIKYLLLHGVSDAHEKYAAKTRKMEQTY